MNYEISDYEYYRILVEGKKLTRHAIKSSSTQQPEAILKKVEIKQKVKQAKKIKIQQDLITCEWCGEPSNTQLCANCNQNKLQSQICHICQKGGSNPTKLKIFRCTDSKCQVYSHVKCDTLFTELNDLTSLEIVYKCQDCRNNLRKALLKDVIRILTYFDEEKVFWNLDPNLVKYFEVIKNPLDFTTIYKKENTFESLQQDIRLIVNNYLEYNPPNTNPHVQGLILRQIYEQILKEVKPLFSSDDKYILYHSELDPVEILKKISKNFLNTLFTQPDNNVQIIGSEYSKYDKQPYSFAQQVQDMQTESKLILWEQSINEFRYENDLEPLVKVNMKELIKHQIQGDIQIRLDIDHHQPLHPYLEYLLDMEPKIITDEVSDIQLDQLITRLSSLDLKFEIETTGKYMLTYLCCSCGVYENKENLLECNVCLQTYHYYCQIPNAEMSPWRVKSALNKFICYSCITCVQCTNPGSEIYCYICGDCYHSSCAFPQMETQPDLLQFWRCSKCFNCSKCGTKQLFDLHSGRSINISIQYFQQFTMCLPCGFEATKNRFCEYCQEYIHMNIQKELLSQFQISQEDYANLAPIYKVYFTEIANLERSFIGSPAPIQSVQCSKCSSFYHQECLKTNFKEMVDGVCADCRQDLSDILFKYEKIKQQSLKNQIQTRQLRKVLPYVCGFLKFSQNLDKKQQQFILTNLEGLDHWTTKFIDSQHQLSQMRNDLAGSATIQDEYLDKLSIYWVASLNQLDMPRSQNPDPINIYDDFYERLAFIQSMRQTKAFIFELNILLSLKFVVNMHIVTDYACYFSELQCCFSQELIYNPGYIYVNNNYYKSYVNIITPLQQLISQQMNQQVFIVQFPNTAARSIKKLLGIQRFNQKAANKNILISKGRIQIQVQQLTISLRNLNLKYSPQQISEKFQIYHEAKKMMNMSIKEIKAIYDEKFHLILEEEEMQQNEQMEVEQVDSVDSVSEKSASIIQKQSIFKIQDKEDLFVSNVINESCFYCKRQGHRVLSGPLIYTTTYCHQYCIAFSQENSVCNQCHLSGASVKCISCRRYCHFYCAYERQWLFTTHKKVYCEECRLETNEQQVNSFPPHYSQHKHQKNAIRFGNSTLIHKDQNEISVVSLLKQPIYYSLNVQQHKLTIAQINLNLYNQITLDNKHLDKVIELALSQMPTQEFQVYNQTDLIKAFQPYINLRKEQQLARLFLLQIANKQQKKTNVFQYKEFKQYFYTDQFVEDLQLDVRTQQIQYLAKVIVNAENSYAQHPMFYVEEPEQIIQKEKLNRKESQINYQLQPYDLIMEAGLLTKDIKPDDDQFEKKLLQDYLKNRRPRLYVAPSLIHKYGLFTKHVIKKGDLVIEYTGEVISNELADQREIQYIEQGFGDCYMFRVNKNQIIDATFRGSEARFLNHSCQPNCASYVVDNKIMIYAKQEIAQSSELTYDYQFEVEAQKLSCYCGAKNCRGSLT